jgi:hypothetical protein
VSTLEAEAVAAYTAEQSAQLAAARDAVKAALVRPDGSTLTLTEVGLERVHADLVRGLVVYSDGTHYLGAHRRDGWRAVVVRSEAGEWRLVRDVTSLAAIGAAFAEA